MSVATFDARVIGAFGRRVSLRLADGREFPGRPLGRGLSIVCGDTVRCRLDERHAEVHVLEVLPRRTALYRSNARGGAEPVLANLERLLVVIAPLPEPDLFVADRYLAAAESAGIEAVLVINKADLGVDAALEAQLAGLCAGGLPADHRLGGRRNRPRCAGRGARRTRGRIGRPSGVGKSSLAARLIPDANITIGSLAREQEGRHTTTASRLYPLAGGGQLADSPGVRDFAPALVALDARSL
ncbi:GTPase EngC, partial [mine drainage metagenome]